MRLLVPRLVLLARVLLVLLPRLREVVLLLPRVVPELPRVVLDVPRVVLDVPRVVLELLRLAPELLRELLAELRELAVFAGAPAAEPRRLAVVRLTSLLKRDSWPPLVVSWYSRASLLSSKALNHSSQEIGSRLSSPLQPGKLMRSMPGSFLPPVPLTRAGFPSRSSAQRRMKSWSVVVLL